MNYKDAKWLLDVSTDPYISTPHIALQVDAASFIQHYDLEHWDADEVRERFASFQFKLRIMEIRRRLCRETYQADHGALREELDEAIADARKVMIEATEDPRQRFSAREKAFSS